MSEEHNQCCADGTCTIETEQRISAPHYTSSTTDTGLEFSIDLPAVSKENVKLTSEGNELTLTAKRESNAQEDWQLINDHETPTDYKLSLEVHPDLDLASTKASFENGVLKLSITKKEAALPREINILN